MALRWGIVGCGDVCERKSGPALQLAKDSQLVAVMRRNGALAEDFARRHNVPRWYDDAAKLIADPEVDIVYVATPPGTHEFYARQVLAACKPCYVEKPFARCAAECQRMVDSFTAAKLGLYVAYYRRGMERFGQVKQWVESGQLGRITHVGYRFSGARHVGIDPNNLEWRLQVKESGGGLFMDLGSHALDIIDHIMGPLANLSGQAANLASNYAVEDNVAMQGQFAQGALFTGNWNFASAVSEDIIEITGTEARVALSAFGEKPIRRQTRTGSAEIPAPYCKPVHLGLVQTIVYEQLGRGTCPSTGVSALRTARWMDQVVEAYYGTRTDGFWDHPERWPGRRV